MLTVSKVVFHYNNYIGPGSFFMNRNFDDNLSSMNEDGRGTSGYPEFYGESRGRSRGRKRGRNAGRSSYDSSRDYDSADDYSGTRGYGRYDDLSGDEPSYDRNSRLGRYERAREDRQEKSGSARSAKIRRFVILAVAEVIVLVGIFAYAYVLKQYNKIQRLDFNEASVKNQNLSIEKLQAMDEGYWNIAVFGIDSRDSSIGRGNNSDVIIIVNINKGTGEIKLVSVFRDTYLKIGDDSYNKINAAYCLGGPQQAIKALNEDMDLNITDYVTFNWKAVATAINILGGVDIELSKSEFAYINAFITETVNGTGIGSVQLEHAGMNHLDGVQAVAYARLRLMDNDYARTERQRKIIKLCFDKCKTADAKTLNDLLGNMLSMVATNMTWQHGIDAIAQLEMYHFGDTGGFPFARGEAVIGKRGSCVIPQTLESNVSQLHKFFYDVDGYDPSETVKTISAKISVDSGMYNEGTAVGHVSTEGSYIPNPKSESAAEGGSSESPQESAINVEGISAGDGDDDKTEYAISRDGYLIYVESVDQNGNKKYKYVLGDDGKRIKMVETAPDGSLIYLYETDENGNFIFGDGETGVQEGISEPETDEAGNPVDSTRETDEDDMHWGPGGNPNKPAAGPGDDDTKPTKSPSSPENESKAPTSESRENVTPSDPETQPSTEGTVPTAPSAEQEGGGNAGPGGPAGPGAPGGPGGSDNTVPMGPGGGGGVTVVDAPQ